MRRNWGKTARPSGVSKGEISTLKPTSQSIPKASAPCTPASIGQAHGTCLEAPKNTNPASGYLELGPPGSTRTYPDRIHHAQTQQQGAQHRPGGWLPDFSRISRERDSSSAPRSHSIPVPLCVSLFHQQTQPKPQYLQVLLKSGISSIGSAGAMLQRAG